MILALAVPALAGCGDNDAPSQPDAATADAAPDADTSPRAITLRFTPQVGNAAFACGQTYPNMGSEMTTISPRDFRFYLHDIKLIAANGARVPVTLDQDQTWQHQNLAMLDFEDFTGECKDGTVETNLTVRGMVPNGTYTGMSFVIGVPEAMNHVDLVTQPAPLNVTGLWWGWQFGHIFFAAVTHTDITTPTPGTNDHYIHIGSVECLGDPEMGQAVVCNKPNRSFIELTGFDPLTQPIIADFGAVIEMSALTTSPGCHSFSQPECGFPFDRVGLNWFTGSQTPTTQKVFRVSP